MLVEREPVMSGQCNMGSLTILRIKPLWHSSPLMRLAPDSWWTLLIMRIYWYNPGNACRTYCALRTTDDSVERCRRALSEGLFCFIIDVIID